MVVGREIIERDGEAPVSADRLSSSRQGSVLSLSGAVHDKENCQEQSQELPFLSFLKIFQILRGMKSISRPTLRSLWESSVFRDEAQECRP